MIFSLRPCANVSLFIELRLQLREWCLLWQLPILYGRKGEREGVREGVREGEGGSEGGEMDK